MPVVTVDSNEQLLAEYQAAGETPVVFYFFAECDAICDEFNPQFDQIVSEFADSVIVVKAIFTGHSILDGTDFTVDTLPTVIVGVNGIESCEDKLVESQITEDSLRELFQKYSNN